MKRPIPSARLYENENATHPARWCSAQPGPPPTCAVRTSGLLGDEARLASAASHGPRARHLLRAAPRAWHVAELKGWCGARPGWVVVARAACTSLQDRAPEAAAAPGGGGGRGAERLPHLPQGLPAQQHERGEPPLPTPSTARASYFPTGATLGELGDAYGHSCVSANGPPPLCALLAPLL